MRIPTPRWPRNFGSSPSLTREDYEAIRREISGVVGISPEVRTFAQLAAGNQNANAQVTGVGEEFEAKFSPGTVDVIISGPVPLLDRLEESDVRVVIAGKTVVDDGRPMGVDTIKLTADFNQMVRERFA